ncbi:MAG: transporter [Gammaproteobacteria bacterium]|nr:MAG: transporter [Gammaproteobacteria bacterium]
MNVIIVAILPTILLLVLGNMLRRRGFVPREFWPSSDKLTYFVLFPALLISKVSQVDLSRIDLSKVFIFVLLYFALMSLLAWGIYRLSRAQARQFSSLYQGVLRFNSYIYFAVIAAVWGQGALAMSALVAGIMIPLVNICCVASFAVASGHFSWTNTLTTLVKNPLIIAAGLGFIANLFPLLLPQVLFDTLVILSKAALPLALLSVGAAVRVKMLFASHHQSCYRALWLDTVVRLILAPAIALSLSSLLGISQQVSVILVLFAAVPTATSSYILSRQLKGDADLMAAIISLQTLLSIPTLIFWLSVLSM